MSCHRPASFRGVSPSDPDITSGSVGGQVNQISLIRMIHPRTTALGTHQLILFLCLVDAKRQDSNDFYLPSCISGRDGEVLGCHYVTCSCQFPFLHRDSECTAPCHIISSIVNTQLMQYIARHATSQGVYRAIGYNELSGVCPSRGDVVMRCTANGRLRQACRTGPGGHVTPVRPLISGPGPSRNTAYPRPPNTYLIFLSIIV